MEKSPVSSPRRQRHIWSTRAQCELEKCYIDGALPRGATLRRAQVSKTRGLCEGEFHCFVPFVDGSDALALVPLTNLVIRMPFYEDRLADGHVQYPFLAPEVEICDGAIYLPSALREQKLPKSDGKAPIFLLKLPLLEQWSPSTTLRMVLHQFFQLVQQNDPTPSMASDKKLAQQTGHKSGKGKQPLKLRKKDIRGAMYPCQEVDLSTVTLKQTSMLIQAGNIALLLPSREAGDGNFVYVNDLIPLQDIVRITPQRGKSLTLFFKNRSSLCRMSTLR